jgi:hypothetical protein
MGNNEIGLRVSKRTPTLVLSLTLSMILVKSENLEPKVSPYCVKKSALCGEWATTGLYSVVHNYCYSTSDLVHPVERIRNRSNIFFHSDTIWVRLTFGINKKCEPKSKRKDVYIHGKVVQLQTQLLAPLQIIKKTIIRVHPCIAMEIVSSLVKA